MKTAVSEQSMFDRILASLHDSMLDDSHWSSTSALIDDVCRVKGNHLVFGDGRPPDDVQIILARALYRGQRDEDLEREYFDVYYPVDERVARLRQLPDSQIVHVTDLYTNEELKTSAAYNEFLCRAYIQNSLNVRLDGPNGSRVVWCICDPIDGDGWSSSQIELIRGLLPHVRQYVLVRQALADFGALGASLTGLLEKNGSGIIQLDRRGRIVAANDRARDLLRKGDGLFDLDGSLYARFPAANAVLQRLLARALPPLRGHAASGSMIVRRSTVPSDLTLHVSPVVDEATDLRAWRVAALVLVVDPESPAPIDPALVGAALGLTPTEAQVALLLAEGKAVRDIAEVTGRTANTIRWHIRRIFEKHGISRQVELVQLVRSLSGTS